jgi:hypothetical protein
MNKQAAADMVVAYAFEATDRLKPEEDGYMLPDGRQLFEVQPLDEFIIDIRKELLDVMNYAAFGLKRLDDILAKVERLGPIIDLLESEPTSMAGEAERVASAHLALAMIQEQNHEVVDTLSRISEWDLDEAAMDGPR